MEDTDENPSIENESTEDMVRRERKEHLSSFDAEVNELVRAHYEYENKYKKDSGDDLNDTTSLALERCRAATEKILGEEKFLSELIQEEKYIPALTGYFHQIASLNWGYQEGSEYLENIFNFVGSLIERRLSKVEKDMIGDDQYNIPDSIRMVESFLKISAFVKNEKWHQSGVEIFEKNMPVIEEKIMTAVRMNSRSYDAWVHEYALSVIMKLCPPAMAEQAADLVVKIFLASAEGKSAAIANTFLKDMLRKKAPLQFNAGRLNILPAQQHVLEKILDEYHLDPEKFFKGWTMSGYDPDASIRTYEVFEESLKTIRALELKRSGAAKLLHDDFGIVDFNRYPLEVLIDQFDYRDDIETDWIVLFNALEDYNGAISDYSSHKIIASLHKSVTPSQEKDTSAPDQTSLPEEKHNAMRLRIFEAENFVYAGVLIRRAKNKYGLSKVGIANPHGAVNLIRAGQGRDNRYGVLKTEDFEEKMIENLNPFDPGSPFVFTSCSTGVGGGIAQKLSKVWHLNVRAPLGDSECALLQPLFENGILVDFEVRYLNPKTREPIPDMHYKDGVLEATKK